MPRDLEDACLKCLDKRPQKRYASAEALADDLDRYVAGEPVVARRVSRLTRFALWCRREPVLAGTVAAAIAAVGAVASVGFWQVVRVARPLSPRTRPVGSTPRRGRRQPSQSS